MVFSGPAGVVHVGCVPGADRHAAHMPVYVVRHAPGSASKKTAVSGFGRERAVGCGREIPTCLLQGDKRGQYKRIFAQRLGNAVSGRPLRLVCA
jgi:hypothetical protein